VGEKSDVITRAFGLPVMTVYKICYHNDRITIVLKQWWSLWLEEFYTWRVLMEKIKKTLNVWVRDWNECTIAIIQNEVNSFLDILSKNKVRVQVYNEATKKYSALFKKIIKKFATNFECNQTRLYWKQMPEVTLIFINKIGKVYSLEYIDIQKVFFIPHHIGHCWTSVIQGHCCTILCSKSDLRSFLCQCCNQDGGSTGVSRPGG
jgi:hypothetical protein